LPAGGAFESRSNLLGARLTPLTGSGVGDEPVTAVWVVVGRHGDPRTAGFEAEQASPEQVDTPAVR
jgi:hypothetical protein